MSSRPPARLGDRSLFPRLLARAYLNHGGIAPASDPVCEAIQRLTDEYARKGSSAYPTWDAQRWRLKGKLAGLLGAGVRPEDLAFVQSTTYGILHIALCFPFRPGDRVIVFDGEFPANVTPWQRAAERFGCEVVFLPLSSYHESDEAGLTRLERELKRGARLVAVSSVQFKTGLRMPIEAITALCHAHGAEVFVDAVQACGIVPIDYGAAGVDYLSSGSHKWMMGLEGSGYLYVRPDRVGALHPTISGWLSHEDPVKFLFEGPGHFRYDRPVRKQADFLQAGNLNAAGLAGMEAALDLILEIGVPAIFEHVNRYHDALEAGLVEQGFGSLRPTEARRRSGILSVAVPEGLSVVDVHRELGLLGITCALPDGALRFTPHWPNHLDEVSFVLGAVEESLAALRG